MFIALFVIISSREYNLLEYADVNSGISFFYEGQQRAAADHFSGERSQGLPEIWLEIVFARREEVVICYIHLSACNEL